VKKLIMITLIAMIAGFSGSCSKENEIDGGWTAVDPGIEEVKDAVAFIRKDISMKHPDITIGKIYKAEMQTVAGDKFDLLMEYTSDLNSEPKKMRVKLFCSLQGEYKITDIDFNGKE